MTDKIILPETRPLPNEHSCRLEDPGKYDTCRRGERIADKPDSVAGKKYFVIYCKKGDGPMEQQAFRYPKDNWTVEQARDHCKYNDGAFEPAQEEESINREIEHRSFPFLDVRVAGKEDEPIITGHAAVFNQLSDDLGFFREIIKPGAFTKTLQENREIYATFNHDDNFLLGRVSSGTLTLREDEQGLYTEIKPPNTQIIRDLVLTPMRRGDLKQMSFTFQSVKDKESWEGTAEAPVRVLSEVKLFEVAPVVNPAYPQTDANLRSAFMQAGIDPDGLLAALKRAEKKLANPADWEALFRTASRCVQAIEPLEARYGRVLSSANEEKIRKAADLIMEVLSALEEPAESGKPGRSVHLLRQQLELLRREFETIKF